jgi:predicted neutral ceramidase superfamily lipid hydrolase
MDVTKIAIGNMDVAGVACRTITVPNVKVIGAKKLEALCVLIDRSAKRAKRIVGPIFTVSGLLLMLFLLLV